MSTGSAVEGRYEDATKVAPPRPLVQEEFGDLPGVGVEEVKAMLAEGKPCSSSTPGREHFVSRQQDIAEGATWRDPERVQEWIGELSKESPSWCTAPTAFTSAAAPRSRCAMPASTRSYMTVGHSGWKAIGAPIKMHA